MVFAMMYKYIKVHGVQQVLCLVPSVLTSSSLIDVEEGQECKHVASALDITWLQTHGHMLLTEDKYQTHNM